MPDAEQFSGDLADQDIDQEAGQEAVANRVAMDQILPVPVFEVLERQVAHLLASGRPAAQMPALLVAWMAPLTATRDHAVKKLRWLHAEQRHRLGQAATALTEVTAEVRRLGNLAHQRGDVAHRLREELAVAVDGAERFEALTEQECAAGLHGGWYTPSEGRRYACPWCQVIKLAGPDEAARLAALAEVDELEQLDAAITEADQDAVMAGETPEMSAYDMDPDIDDDLVSDEDGGDEVDRDGAS